MSTTKKTPAKSKEKKTPGTVIVEKYRPRMNNLTDAERQEKKMPGTVMAAKIRARANKLTDSEREALMGDAMRIIYGSEGNAVRAHRR